MSDEPELLAILRAVAECGDLDEMIASVHRLPPDTPLRGQFAAGLAVIVLNRPATDGLGAEIGRAQVLDGLLGIADQDPPKSAYWRQQRAAARGRIMLGAAASGRVVDYDASLAELDALDTELEDAPQIRALLGTARSAIVYLRAEQQGDHSVHARAPFDFSAMRGLVTGSEDALGMIDFLERMTRFNEAMGHDEDVSADLEWLAENMGRFAVPGHPMSEIAAPVQMSLKAMRYIRGDIGDAEFSAQELAALEELARNPGQPPDQRAGYHLVVGGVYLRAGEETDPERIALGIRNFEAARDLTNDHDEIRVMVLQSLGMALWRYVELTNDLDRLTEARLLLERALEIAGGPQHAAWSLINGTLSLVRRREGDLHSHLDLLEGLRHETWEVLLQDDPTAARAAARRASDTALDAARQCVLRTDVVSAIQALDSGRSLMLYSAAAFRDVAPQLEAAGKRELAERWRQVAEQHEPDRLSGSLRHEVLSVLADAADLLNPPSLDDIRGALRVLDADALVYLVPAGSNLPGFALLAPAEGAPSLMTLTELRTLDEAEVERYFRALARRDLAPTARDVELTESLETLCDWAWGAAVGPLVDRYLQELPEPPPGRPHRLMLIPMGELALIPWQAARRPGGGYAIDKVSFSFAGSARLLCRAADLEPVAPTPVALVLGDPDTGGSEDHLVAARFEAYAVHQAFYRAGRYLGTRPNGTPSPSGRGTAEQVREWLTTDGLGTILHLACHGVLTTATAPPSASLVLADGESITAEEIVPLLSKAGDRAIALAVLAACRTGRSAHGYDEAYSVGSAFLTAGVRSVLSTQWSIPDEDTSALMFMFHHYFTHDRLPAWAALRQAQLWMLDPDRELPETMPAPLRSRLTGHPDDLTRVEAWAGFIHFGQ
ncbi:MAG TPA: CHAT domain-containing protein [Actinospica sp.]|jgi:hypothetical protein|nr:CHAT domain-containing protein [Actinospica sp.]